jgi:hypothetical protein
VADPAPQQPSRFLGGEFAELGAVQVENRLAPAHARHQQHQRLAQEAGTRCHMHVHHGRVRAHAGQQDASHAGQRMHRLGAAPCLAMGRYIAHRFTFEQAMGAQHRYHRRDPAPAFGRGADH